MKFFYRDLAFLLLLLSTNSTAGVCPFNSAKVCTIQRDILNDTGTNGLRYYAPTNYDHRMSGEIELYKSNLVSPYTGGANAPGQLALKLLNNYGSWTAGEIMTRAGLNLWPFNAPVSSNRWTTQEISHGYLEVIVKMPKCETSSDGVCNGGNPPNYYSKGFWPAIWMMPTMDSNWPLNAEIDISEAYLNGTNYNVSTATLHFNGNSPSCYGGDCVYAGFGLTSAVTSTPLWNAYHIWGFEWRPDPNSTDGGRIITGYFDNVKVWGPLSTDSLPADGKNALSRGFNDPNGGYYLIVNFAVGGGYAGAPNPSTLTSTMYLQSAKAYAVSDPSPTNCLPPTGIQSMYSSDKKQITIAWLAPTGSSPIANYQVSDWQQRPLWQGTSPSIRVYQDQTLPGTSGTFTYYLSTFCQSGTSAAVKYDVVIP